MAQHGKVCTGLSYILVIACTLPANAHGFGQRYDLPIPLSLYVWSAGATVALSFAIFALFLRHGAGRRREIQLHLNARLVRCSVLIAQSLTLMILVLVIAAGLFGSQDPVRNIAPVMVWVIGWVGFGFLSVLVGNVWALINPWSAAFAVAESAFGRWRQGAVLGFRQHYPAWLGVWPAFVLFVVFAWMELVWSVKTVPAQLAIVLLGYSVGTWIGMLVYGRATWLDRGEIFNLVFGIFGRFAPLAEGPACSAIRLRPPAEGLLKERPLTFSMMALVLALLATVTFDGLLETPLWARVDFAVFDAASDPDLPFWKLGLGEDQAVRLVRTIGLIACVLIFLGAYMVVCRATAAISGTHAVTTGTVARQFVLTLVPISLAYHVAHYFSLLFIGGQYAIPLLSDPLGKGWNLFGTATYRVDISIVTPRLHWTIAVVAVVLGHVIAVYLAHVTALRVFHDRRAALLSQLPMVLLMIGYTMVSLWILSQPIVEARGA